MPAESYVFEFAGLINGSLGTGVEGGVSSAVSLKRTGLFFDGNMGLLDKLLLNITILLKKSSRT